jgi:hypothetical protein
VPTFHGAPLSKKTQVHVSRATPLIRRFSRDAAVIVAGEVVEEVHVARPFASIEVLPVSDVLQIASLSTRVVT